MRTVVSMTLVCCTSLLGGCAILDEINGDGRCDALNLRGVRDAYVVGDTALFETGMRDQANAPVQCLGTVSASWTSSRPAVGTVTPGGLFIALSPGTTLITARSESMEGEKAVTVRTR